MQCNQTVVIHAESQAPQIVKRRPKLYFGFVQTKEDMRSKLEYVGPQNYLLSVTMAKVIDAAMPQL